LQVRIAGFKNHTIKQTINQVSDGTRINEGYTNDVTNMVFFLDDVQNIIGAKGNSHQPENSEGYFTPVATKLPSIGHSLILNKMKPQPGNGLEQDIFLAHVVTGLDVYFQCLINKQDQKSQEKGVFELQNAGFCKYNDKGTMAEDPGSFTQINPWNAL
jgi:hypothetical protein